MYLRGIHFVKLLILFKFYRLIKWYGWRVIIFREHDIPTPWTDNEIRFFTTQHFN